MSRGVLRWNRARAARSLAVLALALPAGGCAGQGQDEQELTVLAAASLQEALTQVGTLFEQEHPGTAVTFSFAGSATLVSQALDGFPADVLATADEQTMARAVAGGVASEPAAVATNSLRLVTPSGNPARITGLDESLAGSALVVCAPQVPCGSAAVELADRLDVELAPVSAESSVTDVLGKVTSGQADAGLVYASDVVRAGGAVEVVEVPVAEQVVTTYPMALLTSSEQPALAREWIATVRGAAGQEILAEAGFDPA